MTNTDSRSRLARQLLRLLLLGLVLPSCAAPARDGGDAPEGWDLAPMPAPEPGELYVSVGDEVVFTDLLHPEISGEVTVRSDGTIGVPEVGSVHIAGLTEAEIAGLLSREGSAYFTQTDFRVRITPASKFYYVAGEEPLELDAIPLEADTTLLEAVIASEPSERTDLSRVVLVRPDPKRPLILRVDLAQMLATGDTTYNVLLLSADVIHLPLMDEEVR